MLKVPFKGQKINFRTMKSLDSTDFKLDVPSVILQRRLLSTLHGAPDQKFNFDMSTGLYICDNYGAPAQ